MSKNFARQLSHIGPTSLSPKNALFAEGKCLVLRSVEKNRLKQPTDSSKSRDTLTNLGGSSMQHARHFLSPYPYPFFSCVAPPKSQDNLSRKWRKNCCKDRYSYFFLFSSFFFLIQLLACWFTLFFLSSFCIPNCFFVLHFQCQIKKA